MPELQAVSRNVVTIPLSYPVEWFGKMVGEIKLKEPTAAQFFRLGEPQIVVYAGASGGGSMVDVPDVINSYLDVCVVGLDSPEHLLGALPLADGRAIRKAILGFFRDAPEATSG